MKGRAMAVLVRYTPTSLTREKYDAVNEVLMAQGADGPPEALLLHVLFGDSGSMRVSEIWSDEETWRGFYDGVLTPAFSQVGLSEDADPELMPVETFWGSATTQQIGV
jgi:hypothetical protein